jgi:hypothetical protein
MFQCSKKYRTDGKKIFLLSPNRLVFAANLFSPATHILTEQVNKRQNPPQTPHVCRAFALSSFFEHVEQIADSLNKPHRETSFLLKI